MKYEQEKQPTKQSTYEIVRDAYNEFSREFKNSWWEFNVPAAQTNAAKDVLLKMIKAFGIVPTEELMGKIDARARDVVTKSVGRVSPIRESHGIEKMIFNENTASIFKDLCHFVARTVRTLVGKPTLADEIENAALRIVKEEKAKQKGLEAQAKKAGKAVTGLRDATSFEKSMVRGAGGFMEPPAGTRARRANPSPHI